MLRNAIQRFLLASLALGLGPAALAAPHDGHHAPTTVAVNAHGSARLNQLQRRVATNPTNALLLSQLGAEHLALAKRSASHPQYRAAESAYRSWLAVETDSAAAHFGLSYALLGQHRFAEALEHGRSAAALQPDELQVWALLGDLHFALGNYVEADFAYRALEQNALELVPAMHAARFRIAKVEIVEGHGDHALPLLEALVREHPLPRYRLQLGRLLRARGQAESGQSWIDGVEVEILDELASGDMGHVRELAELYLHEETHLDRALELAQLDLDRIRHDSNTYETLAWAQFRNGMLREAQNNITRALASGASSTRLLCRAARIHSAAGNESGARRLLQLAGERDALLDAQWRVAATPNSAQDVASAFSAAHMSWVLTNLD